MTEPSTELQEWADETGAELDVEDHPNVPEDGDWLLHLEDELMQITLTHFTEEDGAGVLYGEMLEKQEDGRQFDLMLQEEPMIQEIPKLGESLRFKPTPEAQEIAVGLVDGMWRAKVVGHA